MRKVRGQNLIQELDAQAIRFPAPIVAGGEDYTNRDLRASCSLKDKEASVTGDIDRPKARCNTLILGMGSEFLGDDGVGVHALRELGKQSLPEGTELIEVANRLVDALVALQRADRIILLDVLRAQGKPGSVYRVSFQTIPASEELPRSQSLDLFRALYLGRCFGFLDVIIVGMEPSVIDWSSNLSEEVRNALPLMIRTVRAELDRPVARGLTESAIPLANYERTDPSWENLRRHA